MAAAATPMVSSPIFTASFADPFPVPFGHKIEAIEGSTSTTQGVLRPIVHMDEHLKLIRSSIGANYISPHEYPLMGGYHDGLYYQPIPVPQDIIPHMGLVIGKEGFYFKKITEASGVMLIWYNLKEKMVEVFSGQTRYHHDGNDGLGSFEYCDDIVGGDENDVWMEYFLDGKALVDDAVERIHVRFATVRDYLIQKELEKTNGFRFPKEFTFDKWIEEQRAMSYLATGRDAPGDDEDATASAEGFSS